MSYTESSISILDGAAISKTMTAYTDGTSFNFAHSLLDDNGALIAPATAALQGAANTSLAQIVTAVQAATPAGANIIGNVRIDQTTPGTTNGVQIAAAIPAGSNLIGNVGISAGTAIIGKVGIDQTKPGTTNGVYVTSGSAALPAPIPVKFTGASLTRVANTTTYVAGQVVFSTTATGQVVTTTCQVSKATDQAFTMLRARLSKSNSGLTNAIFRLHFYNIQPTLTSGDGSTWITGYSGYIGNMDITMGQAFTNQAVGYGVPLVGSTIADIPVSGTNYVYVAIEARAAYVPASAEVFTPTIEVQ